MGKEFSTKKSEELIMCLQNGLWLVYHSGSGITISGEPWLQDNMVHVVFWCQTNEP